MDTTLDLHLRVVGGLLEEHQLFHGSRLHAVKDLVLRVMEARLPENSTLRQIQEVLCFDDIPLVSEEILRQAINALVRDEKKVVVVGKHPKDYKLAVVLAPRTSSLGGAVDSAWERHFSICTQSTVNNFRRGLARLFAKYGCAAYDTLISKASGNVELASVLADEASGDPAFVECFEDFVLSAHPEDALLKVKLASTYALLRMNGAGNWNGDELKAFFDGKTFVLDTNVLFELMSRNIGQVTKMFELLQGYGAKFAIGSETSKEFERALRTRAKQIGDILANGVKLGPLVDAQVLRADWIAAMLRDFGNPSREQIAERVDALLTQVNAMLDGSAVTRVHLDRGGDPDEHETRVDQIKQLALESRHFTKGDEVAAHDALLWGALEEAPRLADIILTLDRSLGRIRVGGRRAAVMLDEVVAYALIGGAGEDELAGLFNHTLSQDLHPDAAFLTLEEIQMISGMESSLLTAPPKALKRAAVRLAQVRAERVSSGEAVRDDEIGKILLTAVASYRDDRAVAERALNEVERERQRAEHELEAKLALAKEAGDLKERLALGETLAAARTAAAEQKSQAAEAELNRLRGETALHRAEDEERARRKLLAESEDDRARESARRRRDWMLWCASVFGAAVVLALCGILWAACVAAIASMAALVWTALAQETPSVSLAILSFGVAVVVAGAGITEKWPQARGALRVPTPASSTGPVAPPSAATRGQ